MRNTAFIKPVAFSPIFKMLAFIHNLGNTIIDPEKSYDWEEETQKLWTTEVIRSIHLSLTKGTRLQNEITSLNLGLTRGPLTPPILCRRPPGHIHYFIQIPNQLVNPRYLRRSLLPDGPSLSGSPQVAKSLTIRSLPIPHYLYPAAGSLHRCSHQARAHPTPPLPQSYKN